MDTTNNKKLLILGGSTNMIDLVVKAQSMGFYTIVTDWYDTTSSPAKKIANEYWDLSITDYESIVERIKTHNVTGIITAITDSYLAPYAHLCKLTNLPCYASEQVFELSTDKRKFKAMCNAFDIPTAKKYEVTSDDKGGMESLPYPVIVKPSDGSGSRGFNVCKNKNDFEKYYPIALSFSPSKTVVVEDFIPYDAVIIHYTMINGKCYYSGMSDKISKRFASSGSSVMGIQLFPSRGETAYLSKLDLKVKNMFEKSGFKDGPIWIEAFYDGKELFLFNEMAHRFGGSLTYYPVEFFYGFNQLEQLIHLSHKLQSEETPKQKDFDKNYCIIPFHVKPGVITSIDGVEEIKNIPGLYAYCPAKVVGQEVKEWGTTLNVFSYMHFTFESINGLKKSIKDVLQTLKVYDENKNNMLYALFDVDSLNEYYNG